MAALRTSNITTSLVKNTLRENSRDVGTLCTSDKINVESKFKPVSYPAISDITEAELISTNYGISEDSIGNIRTALVNPPTTLKKWIYNKPTGTSESPYRLGDFRGYDHTAKFKEGDWGIVRAFIAGADIAEFNGIKIIKAADLIRYPFIAQVGFKTTFDYEHLLTPKQLLFIDDNISEEDDGKLQITIYKQVPYDSTLTRYVRDAVVYSPTKFTDMVTIQDLVLPINEKGDANLNYPIDQSFIDNKQGMFIQLQQWIHFSRGTGSIIPVGYERCLAITADGSPHTDTYYIDGGAYGYVDGVRISQAFSDNGTNDGWIIEGYMNCLPSGDRKYNGGTPIAIPSFHYWYGYVQEDGTYFASDYAGDIYTSKSSLMSMDTGRQLIRASMIKNSDFRINAAAGFCVSAGGNPNFNNSQALKSETATLDTTNLEIGNTKDSGLWIVGKATRDGNAIEFTADFRNTYKFYNASSTQAIEVGECCVYFKKMSNPMPNSSTDIYGADEAKYTFDVGTLSASTSRKICTWSIPTAYASNNYYVYLITPNHGKYYCKINNA